MSSFAAGGAALKFLAAPLLLSFICCASAHGQSVNLYDMGPTGASYSTTYYASDNWLIQISAGSGLANSPVDMCDPSGCSTGGYYGNTDQNGNFSLSGQFASNDNGSWSENWTVAGTCMSPCPLSFTVNPAGAGPGSCTFNTDSPPTSVNLSAGNGYVWMEPGYYALDGGPSGGSGNLYASSGNCSAVQGSFPQIGDGLFFAVNGTVIGQDIGYVSLYFEADWIASQFPEQTVYDNNWEYSCQYTEAIGSVRFTASDSYGSKSPANASTLIEVDGQTCFN
jgi:hypothetical protein